MDKLYTALNLIKLLNENKKINSSFVAEKLEVSKRTAQRYLQELSSLPGVIYDEKDYSYSLVDSYKFEDAFLSQSELSYVGAIFDFMKKSLNSESAKYMDQLKKKIFHINGSSFTFDVLNDNTIDFENISATLSLLEKNIIENMQITFSYKRTKKDYKVKPLRIILSEGFWYLFAEHNNKYKTFLIDKMENICATNEVFFIDEDIDSIINEAISVWSLEKDKEIVKIKVDNKLLDYFRRRQCLSFQKILEVNEDNFLVEFRVANNLDFIHQIIKWAPFTEIIEPEKYKSALIDFLLDSYNKNKQNQDG